MSSKDDAKLQQHLALLREEYVKVQSRLADAERRAEIAEASAGICTNTESYISRLVRTVSELFEKDLYSDITIHVDGHQLRAHRFVLTARSDNWDAVDLSTVDRLELNNISYGIFHTLLKWVYTDKLSSQLDDMVLFDLMIAAARFQLESLFERAQGMLVSRLEFKNCIRFYQFADEVDAKLLLEQSLELITLNWGRFTGADFEEMPASLLYKMLKARTKYSLHAAIKLKREDVVFLYLVEFDAELIVLLNQLDGDGNLPLALALFSDQNQLASSILSHGAGVDAVDGKKKTTLIRAIEESKLDAALFLIENDADVNSIQPGTNRTILHLLAMLHSDASAAGDDLMSVPPKNFEPTPEQIFRIVTATVNTNRANINLQDWMGDTPLHLAIKHNKKDIFEQLTVSVSKYDPSIDLTLRNDDGYSPLWYALNSPTERQSFGMAHKLIDLGSNVNEIHPESGNSLLQLAICGSNEDAAMFLLSKNINVNHANLKGETALHQAAAAGLTMVCRKLINIGANPNSQTYSDENNPFESHGKTPLHVAIAESQRDIIKIFLEASKGTDSKIVQPDFTLRDSTGETALGFCLWSTCFETAKELIVNGADVNDVNNEGYCMLHRAISQSDVESALFLIQNKADVNLLTPQNETPLQLAIQMHQLGVVRALCNAGADLNIESKEGNCPLWDALDAGQEDIASVLVEFGADRDFWSPGPGGCQQTLLHRALDENNEAIGAFLVRSLCDLNATRRAGPNGEAEDEVNEKQTPLHMAASWGLEIIGKTLIEHGADVNTQDVNGRTPVHLAVLNHQDDILSHLIRAPTVNLSIRDRKNATPFAVAMSVKNNRAAGVILGKDPKTAYETDAKGCNFLHSAIKNADLESVLFLLSVHMDVNIPVNDSSRFLPLHLAAQVGEDMITRNLLLAGANANALTTTKKTALHIATLHDNPAICSILLNHGIEFDAVDDGLNNALHLACQSGSIGSVKVLLNESKIHADAVNKRGQIPLHVLAQYGKDNAAAIFDLFLQSIPNYPIDRPDADGSTTLLLAYMNGNAQLCKTIVRAGVCIGVVNAHGVSIFNYQVATKQLLNKLLDQLTREPKWAEGEACSECLARFSITIRKHHCRHCGRLLCSKCSEKTLPILKYDLQKPVRVCDTCFDVLTIGAS